MSKNKNQHIENIKLRSEEVQDILTSVPNWMIRWGSVLFLFLIMLLLAISWFVKYPDIIVSEVIVTTQIPPQKEYAKSTGKLHNILVKDNEIVNENTILAVMENTADYKDVIILQSVLDTIKVSHNKTFNFPTHKLPILFLGDMESDFALFENAYMQYRLNIELQPFANDAIANKITSAELKRRLINLKSQKQLQSKELNFKKKDLERTKTLFDRGVISAQEYESKQLQYLQTKRNYKTMSMSISQLREAISNAKRTTKDTEISKTKEEMILLKNVIQSLNQLKKSIKNWEMRYVLKSDIKGKVSFLNVWNENQTVNQGDLVFTIIPTENSTFIAKLKTPSRNSGKIKIGQKVNIKLENYPDYEFGMLQGTVKNMSLLPNKDGLYLIDVTLPKKLITSYNKTIAFKQEMRGTAEIITEDLRLIERFFYQFRKVLDR
jgi:multidrug efflux pump subunit AcrA (membrane-fusion protein)